MKMNDVLILIFQLLRIACSVVYFKVQYLPTQVPIAPELRSHRVPGGQALAAVHPATQLKPTISQYCPIGQEPGAHPEI